MVLHIKLTTIEMSSVCDFWE